MRLPRAVESDPRLDEIRQALDAHRRLLWPGGTLPVAVVPLTSALRGVLQSPATRRGLQRGLESAATVLAAEQRGLQALPTAVTAGHGERVSRVLLIANDGAERFYRQVERLALAHAPRVLVCLVDCTSLVFGELLAPPGSVVKLVLTVHKATASAVLRALGTP